MNQVLTRSAKAEQHVLVREESRLQGRVGAGAGVVMQAQAQECTLIQDDGSDETLPDGVN